MKWLVPLGLLGLLGLIVLLIIYLIKPNVQKKAVSSTWGTSKTVTVTVMPPYTPPTDGGLGVAEVEISIKLSSGKQSDTWTYTATYTVEKGTV